MVEDDKNLREVLAYNLRREGYRVLTVAYGKEAVQLAYAEQPDLVILDLMLPDLSGFEVCRMFHRQLTMPILMVSTCEEEVDKLLGLELGADDYLIKPFCFRELLARVHTQLRRVEMLRLPDPLTLAPTISNEPPKPSDLPDLPPLLQNYLCCYENSQMAELRTIALLIFSSLRVCYRS